MDERNGLKTIISLIGWVIFTILCFVLPAATLVPLLFIGVCLLYGLKIFRQIIIDKEDVKKTVTYSADFITKIKTIQYLSLLLFFLNTRKLRFINSSCSQDTQMMFAFLRPGICIRLLSDSYLQWTSLASAQGSSLIYPIVTCTTKLMIIHGKLVKQPYTPHAGLLKTNDPVRGLLNLMKLFVSRCGQKYVIVVIKTHRKNGHIRAKMR